ncbi:hypothetical protein TSMEX_002499, partial [Taenia solium]
MVIVRHKQNWCYFDLLKDNAIICADFIDYKFADVGGTLIELKCRNRLADMPHRPYLECLRNSRESISEVMESFVRSTFMHNDTFDGASTFLFNLMLSLR